MAEEAAPNATVPDDGQIVGNDVKACPSDLIWVQPIDENLDILVNIDLVEGVDAASKKRRAASKAAIPKLLNGGYVKPPIPQNVTRDSGNQQFSVIQRNRKGVVIGTMSVRHQPPPPPLGKPAMGTASDKNRQGVGITGALRLIFEKVLTVNNITSQAQAISKVTSQGVKDRDLLFQETFEMDDDAKAKDWACLYKMVIKPDVGGAGGAGGGLGAAAGPVELDMAAYNRIVGGVQYDVKGNKLWYLKSVKDKLAPLCRLLQAFTNAPSCEIRGDGRVVFTKVLDDQQTMIYEHFAGEEIEIYPGSIKCTIRSALISDINNEYKLYSKAIEKFQNYEKEMQTFKDTMEEYKASRKLSGAVAAGAQPKEPEKVHEPSMLGEDLKKRDAYEDGKAPFFCRSEKSDLEFLMQRVQGVHKLILDEDTSIARMKRQEKVPAEQKYIQDLEAQRDAMAKIFRSLLKTRTKKELEKHLDNMDDLLEDNPEPPTKRSKT